MGSELTLVVGSFLSQEVLQAAHGCHGGLPHTGHAILSGTRVAKCPSAVDCGCEPASRWPGDPSQVWGQELLSWKSDRRNEIFTSHPSSAKSLMKITFLETIHEYMLISEKIKTA